MKFGIGIPTCREGRDYTASFAGPQDIVELSQMAERLGFDTVWGDDHITPDQALRTKDPQPPSFYELFTSLAYVAAATKTIRLGIGVMIIVWRDPVLVAKQAATLDVFSGGRLTLGVGLGGSRYEFEAVNPRWRKAHRGKMLDEELEILNLLFTQDGVSFKGQYYEFEDLSLHPKPLQKPFPFYITAFRGDTPESLRRMARWASACAVKPTVEAIRQRKEALAPVLEEMGRDLSEIELTTLPTGSIAGTHREAVERLQRSRGFERYRNLTMEQVEEDNFIGTPAEITEKIAKLEEAGLGHCGMQRFGASSYEELKEQVQMLAEEVLPHFK